MQEEILSVVNLPEDMWLDPKDVKMDGYTIIDKNRIITTQDGAKLLLKVNSLEKIIDALDISTVVRLLEQLSGKSVNVVKKGVI